MNNLINIQTGSVSSNNNLDGRAGADCVVMCKIVNTSRRTHK